jgi:hypothetical protein
MRLNEHTEAFGSSNGLSIRPNVLGVPVVGEDRRLSIVTQKGDERFVLEKLHLSRVPARFDMNRHRLLVFRRNGFNCRLNGLIVTGAIGRDS